MQTNVKVSWKGKLAFTGSAGSEFEVPLDARKDVGGDENGFRPMQLIAVGLAGCTAMDVVSIMQKKRQNLTDFEVEVHADRAEEHPKVFTRATIEYHLTGHGLDEAAVRRSIELSATRYCPGQAMLSQVFPMELVYKIYEAGENGERELVTTGKFTESEHQIKAVD